MAEVVGIDIQVKGNAAESVGSLKKQLREAQAEVATLSDKFGATSEQAINAAKRAAQLKDAIGDAKALTDAYNPDRKFQAFSAALQGVVGGFTAVQGALGLVGVESEEVEKTLLKVNSAMALSQGINSVLEARDSFLNLGKRIADSTLFLKANNIATAAAVAVQRAFGVATVQTAAGFRILKTAIAATGIGLAVVGITALVSKIKDWTSSTNEAAEAQTKLAQKTDLLNSRLNNEISVLTSLGNKEDEIYRKRVEIANNELNVLRNAYKQKNGLTVEEVKRFEELKTQLVTLEIDEKNRIKKVNEDAQKEKEKKDKEAADKAKAVTEERINANKDAEDQIRKLRQDAELNAIEDQNKRAIRQAEIDFENRKLEINELKASEQLKTQLLIEEQKKRDAAIAQLKQEAAQAELDAIFAQFEAEDAANKAEEERRKAAQDKEVEARQIRRNRELAELEERKKTREEFQQAELEAERYLQEQKNALLDAGINFALALAGRNEKLANAIFAVQKAIEIGRIITTTTASITKIKADTFSIPAFVGPGLPNPLFVKALAVMGTKIAGLKIGAAASIASIAASTISKFKGGGGGSTVGGTQDAGAAGGGGGAAPIAPASPQAALTQLDQVTINRLGSASNRAYVLESDVTNSQERITRINRAARLG